MLNTIEHDIWLFLEDSDCEQVLLPGTRGVLGGHPEARPNPSPGDTWRTRRASGGSPGSLARGHVAHPEFSRLRYCSFEQVLLPSSYPGWYCSPAEVLFTRLRYCSSEQVLLVNSYPG